MRLGGAFLLGWAVTCAAIAFGSRPLGVAGIGLLLAAVLARSWGGLVRGGVTASFAAKPEQPIEGDRLRLGVEVRRTSRVPVGSVSVKGTLGRLGRFELPLRGHSRRAVGTAWLGRLPRGQYELSDTRVVLGDHLGLETVRRDFAPGGFALVVYPRLVDVTVLFSDAGQVGGHGRRVLLRRPSGFELHSVREYTQGESLRRVHWPTTARIGQLMVKELEDSPRDAVSVLLDCDPTGTVGLPPDTSFDAAVRAAGSILRHYASRARKAVLVTTGRDAVVQHVSHADGDFRTALRLLAAAEPDAHLRLPAWLRQEPARSSQSGELVVVTSNLEPAALEAILASATRRIVSVVWVDAPSYVGRATRPAPAVLRLSAAGIPVAVVRQGEDLASALDISRAAVSEEAHG
jgi:uncharacterized protein (DUF58 family)